MQVPEVIQKALETTPPTARKSTSKRESVQRKRYWWLPYVVLEFDKNEILIDAMGGDLSSPVWNYRADLYVLFNQYFVQAITSSFTLITSSDVSRTSNISVSSYLRTAAAIQGQDNMGNDLLMGRVDLTPMLDGHVSRLIQPTLLLSNPFSSFDSMLPTSGIAQQRDPAHFT